MTYVLIVIKNISMFSSEDEQKNCLFKVVFGDTITYLFTL